MKTKYSFLSAILTMLTFLINVIYIPTAAAASAADGIAVTGIWETETALTLKMNAENTGKSDDSVGITAVYNESGVLEGVYTEDVDTSENTAEWSEYIDFAKHSGEHIKVLLVGISSMKPLCGSAEMSVEQLCNTAVAKITDSGNYAIRLAFETNTLERIRRDLYKLQMAEFYRVDDIPAHTGQYSCFVTDRLKSDFGVSIKLDDIDYNSKVTISCWVHNGSGVSETKFYIRSRFPTASGTKYDRLSEYVTVKNDEWMELKTVVDLSAYELTDTPGFDILTVNNNDNYDDYYVDDILVTADCEGGFYDDMNYIPPEHGEELSDTPYQIGTEYIPVQEDIPSLKEVYKDYFKIGMAVCDSAAITTEGRYGAIMSKHCNSLVGEGAHKTNGILKNGTTGKTYDFTTADELTDFAHKNGFEIAGHVLVWEAESYKVMTTDINGNFLSRDEILARMKEYITKVITHFEGDGDASEYTVADYQDWHISVWDVVNEAVAYEPTYNNQYVDNGAGFLSIVGSDYIQYAFEYAEDVGYDNVELRYNDYGEHKEDKLNGIYNLCKSLLDNGKKLDVIGMQSHYNPEVTSDSVRCAMEKLSSLGIKINVTELDVRSYTPSQVLAGVKLYETGIPKEVELVQAKLYYDLFQLYKEYSDVIDRVVMWTVTDRLSSTNSSSGFRRTEYGGIFDRNYQAKPQYWAIVGDYVKELEGIKDRTMFNFSQMKEVTKFAF